MFHHVANGRCCLHRFNVYVAQPEVKPGCVLRRSNVRELESRNLVDSKEVHSMPELELMVGHSVILHHV